MSAYLYLVAEVGHLRLQSNEVWEWKNFVTDFESSPCSVTLVGRWKEILRLGCVFSCNGAIWPCVCLRGAYLQSQVVIGWKGVSTPMRPDLDTGLYIGRAIALGLSHCDTVTVTLSHCHRGGEQCALSSDGLHPDAVCVTFVRKAMFCNSMRAHVNVARHLIVIATILG